MKTRIITGYFLALSLFATLPIGPLPSSAAEDQKPTAVFIMAGQSNMEGQGDGSQLPDALRTGNERVLRWVDGAWQPLRPIKPSPPGFLQRGIAGPTFGPEISFGHALAEAWPDRRIGIIKVAVGGTGILAWSPRWTLAQAQRSGDGKKGDLYKEIIDQVTAARKAGPIELKGFFWKQGGKDMKDLSLAQEYYDNLENLILSLRKDLDVPDLPAFIAVPFDPEAVEADRDENYRKLVAERPGALVVARAWVRAGKDVPHTHAVAMPDLERWPKNVHYNTAGLLKSGRLFAKAYLESVK